MYIWLRERERNREREYLRNASYCHRHVVPSAVSLAGMCASTAKPALAGLLALPVPTGRRSAWTASLWILSIFTLANWIYAMWPIFIMGGRQRVPCRIMLCTIRWKLHYVFKHNHVYYVYYMANCIHPTSPMFIMGNFFPHREWTSSNFPAKIRNSFPPIISFEMISKLPGLSYSCRRRYVAFVEKMEFVSFMGNQRVGIFPPKSKNSLLPENIFHLI